MSLIVTGLPSSGKSTFVRILSERALLMNTSYLEVTIIDEQNVRPGTTHKERYSSSKEEKITRAAMKNEFDRRVSGGISGGGTNNGGNKREKEGKQTSSSLVILDATNYIKGYRYELHCISRAAGTRHGVVWVLNDPSVCIRWNEERKKKRIIEKMTKRKSLVAGESEVDKNQNIGEGEDNSQEMDCDISEDDGYYPTSVEMEELMGRYEPPDPRNRWDRPLYRVDMSSSSMDTMTEEKTMDRSVYNMHSLRESVSNNINNNNNDDNSLVNTNITINKTSDVDNINTNCNNNNNNKDLSNAETSKPRIKTKSGFKRATKKKQGAVVKDRGAKQGKFASLADLANGADLSLYCTDDSNGNGKDRRSGVGEKEKYDEQKQVPEFTKRVASTTPMKTKKLRVRTMEEIADGILRSFLYDDHSNLGEEAGDNGLVLGNGSARSVLDDGTTSSSVSFKKKFQQVQPLVSAASTKVHFPAGSDLLHDVDAVTSDIVRLFLQIQEGKRIKDDDNSDKGIGAGSRADIDSNISIPLDRFDKNKSPEHEKNYKMEISRTVSASELRKIQRQFVSWMKLNPPTSLGNDKERSIAISFLSYLEEQL